MIRDWSRTMRAHLRSHSKRAPVEATALPEIIQVFEDTSDRITPAQLQEFIDEIKSITEEV